MHKFVHNDLEGKDAIIPDILVLAPFGLIPTTLYVHASMTLPNSLPYVMFTYLLNQVSRRHRLSR